MNIRLLSLTDEIASDDDRYEVLRVWIDAGHLSAAIADSLPEKWTVDRKEAWAILLSDVGHHVIDAIVLETGRYILDIRARIVAQLEECRRTLRDTIVGAVFTQEPFPDLCANYRSDDVVEMIRIIIRDRMESIDIIIFPCMWLKNDTEEENWGNILYDLTSILSRGKEYDQEYRIDLLEQVIEYIKNPTTQNYCGSFR